MPGADGFTKPNDEAATAVPLKLGFGKNKKRSAAGPALKQVTIHQTNGKDTSLNMVPPAVKPVPTGVGFVDFSSDFGIPEDEGDDDGADASGDREDDGCLNSLPQLWEEVQQRCEIVIHGA